MDHGYGGHPYPSAPQQQFPPPPLQQFAQGGAPPFFPPPPPMAPFPPYGPAGVPYPAAPFVPSIASAPLQQQIPLPQGFFNPWDPPPPIAPPPSDSELQKRIDKLVEYAAKNGPDFEKMLKEKQKDNPLYAFLFGAEGYGYYRYKLWITVNPHLGGPYMTPTMPSMSAPNANFNPAIASMGSSLGTVNPALNAPMHPVSQGVYYDQQQQQVAQQHHQPYFEPSYQESAPAPKLFKGLSGPLPADVAMELQNVLENLTGTKESIKGAKSWFMQRLPFAPALAEALRERVLSLDDDTRQLHIIYLANDILFDSLQRRVNLKELDNEALAFQPVLGSMLAAIYHNPQNKEANQNRLQKILQFWGLKEVYNKEIISALENEMITGPSTSYRVPGTLPGGPQIEKPLSSNLPAVTVTELSGNKEHARVSTPDRAQSFHSPSGKEENPLMAALVAAQYGPTAGSVSALNAPFVSPFSTVGPGSSQSSQLSATVRPTDHPPYPLFPPGLIPGMVRKMQIGTGVPYSALSPLDIPAVIPPSTVSDSYILDRVSKFFKDIGEVDPLEGQIKCSGSDDDEREWNRTGGACIPPPANMAVDPETNTLPDGSVEHKPGSINTGRLGLGAVADPNEITQYDDVYTSYRKQRSTSYHSFMSARSAAR